MEVEKKTWSVVHFLMDDSVAAVPTLWLIGSNKCLWPPFPTSQINTAIKNCVVNTHWPSYEIKSFRDATYECYETARIKAKKAEVSSDLNSDPEINKKRKRIIKRLSSSDRSDNSTDSEILEIIKNPPKLKIPKENHAVVSEEIDILETPKTKANEFLEDHSEFSTPNVYKKKPTKNIVSSSGQPKPGPSAECDCCALHMGYIKDIVKEQRRIRDMLTDLPQIIVKEVRNMQADSPIQKSVFEDFNLPVTTQARLDELNIYIEKKENFQLAVSELAKVGGKDNFDFVKRTLGFLISNELASNFSWLGRRTKKAFQNFPLVQLIISAADKCKMSKNSQETEKYIKEWLHRAVERKKREDRTHNMKE